MPLTPETWRGPLRANTQNSGPEGEDQNDSVVIQLTNGNIVVLWTDNSDSEPGGASGLDVIGQVFDPLGNPIGEEFRANQGFVLDDESEFDAAALDDGSFVVTFLDSPSQQTDNSIRATVWQTSQDTGVLTATSSTISTTPDAGDIVRLPSVASLDDGSYMVVYEFFDASLDEFTVRARHVDANGVQGPEMTLFDGAPFSGGFTDVTALENGSFVAIYHGFVSGDLGIVQQIFDAAGPVGFPSFVADTALNGVADVDASVIGLADGGYVIAWNELAGSNSNIRFQIYESNGVQRGPAGRVNADSTQANEPHLIALADGTFVIAYDDDQQNSIAVMRFNAVGAQQGDRVFLDSGSTELDPSGIGLEDGRFVVGWTGRSGSDDNVFFEFMDTRDAANSPVYAPDSWEIGTIGDDTIVSELADGITHGWNGDDDITEGGSPHEYFGGEGDDTIRIVSDLDGDYHDGGEGSDWLDWSASLVRGGIFNLATGRATRNGVSETFTGFENLLGTRFDDRIIGSSDDNQLDGNSGDDEIQGGDGNDTLNGGRGADTIIGGLGKDLIAGDQGADRLVGSGGRDTVTYAASNAAVQVRLDSDQNFGGHAGGDTLIGIERIIGSRFGDVLDANGRNHSAISGGGGNDVIIGGDGFQILSGQGGNDTITAYSGTDFNSTNVGDEIDGGDGDDVLLGGAGNDIIVGGEGNDFIQGHAGSDIMHGGAGEDTVSYANSDTAVFAHLNDVSSNIGGHADDDQMSGFEVLIGSDFADILSSLNTADATIMGGDGDDRITGGGLRNVLRGGNGNDTILAYTARPQNSLSESTINGGNGDDLIEGASGDDLILGGEGNDTISGHGGADTLNGNGGRDTVTYIDAQSAVTVSLNSSSNHLGDAEGDVLIGFERLVGSSFDDDLDANNLSGAVIQGGDGNDRIRGGDNSQTLIGGSGNDTISASINANENATTDPDLLIGGAGNDVLLGGGGNDTLDGGNGTDTLEGNRGNDLLTGGNGADLFSFGEGDGRDTITDFEDDVDILSFNQDLWGGGLTTTQVLQQFADDSSGDTVFDFGDGQVIVLEGVSDKFTLADDIIFASV